MNPNEETLAFYYLIGSTISQWATVEFSLAQIMGTCFGDNDFVTASVAYSSIESFRAKLQYVDAAIKCKALPASEQANWAKLLDRTSRAWAKRSKLAHYFALHDTTTTRPGRRSLLLPTRPSASTTKRRGQKYPGAIYLRDIAGYQLEFSALMISLDNFRDRINGLKETFPKSAEEVKPPPTLAEIRQRIYGYARTPPRPRRKTGVDARQEGNARG